MQYNFLKSLLNEKQDSFFNLRIHFIIKGLGQNYPPHPQYTTAHSLHNNYQKH